MAAMATRHKAQYRQTFHGRADRVRAIRHAVASYLAGCPRADDVVLVTSEFVTNGDRIVWARLDLDQPGQVMAEQDHRAGTAHA